MSHLLSRTNKQIFGKEIYFREEKKCLQWWGWRQAANAQMWEQDACTSCVLKKVITNYQFSILVLAIDQLDLSHWKSLIIGTDVLKMQEPELANVLNTHMGSHPLWEEKPYRGPKPTLRVLCIRGPLLHWLQIMPVHEEQVFEIKSRGKPLWIQHL